MQEFVGVGQYLAELVVEFRRFIAFENPRLCPDVEYQLIAIDCNGRVATTEFLDRPRLDAGCLPPGATYGCGLCAYGYKRRWSDRLYCFSLEFSQRGPDSVI